MMSSKRHSLVLFVTVILLCSISLNAMAISDIEELNTELNKQETKETYTPTKIWLEFLKLIVVLGLIVLVTWFIIRIFGRQMTNKMQGTWIQVVDEITLGENRGIVLCEVGEKLYAIGVTDHNINLLFEINNPKLLEEISLAQSSLESSASSDSFTVKEIKDLIMASFRTKKPLNTNRDFRVLMDEQFSRLEELSAQASKNNKKDTEEEVMK